MTAPLDPAGDPDRYDPSPRARQPDPPAPGPLDWALDPDRYDPTLDAVDSVDPDEPPRGAGRRATLPDLIGSERSFQDSPSPYVWILGLLGTGAFLLLVAFVLSHLRA